MPTESWTASIYEIRVPTVGSLEGMQLASIVLFIMGYLEEIMLLIMHAETIWDQSGDCSSIRLSRISVRKAPKSEISQEFSWISALNFND